MAAVLSVLVLILSLTLPTRAAIADSRASMSSVFADCSSISCVSPRQLITPKEAWRMKRESGGRLLLVDIRARSELASAGMPIGGDVQVPFMKAGSNGASRAGATAPEVEFRTDFASSLDEALLAAQLRHTDPVVLMSPSRERAVLAALLLQEHGYSRIFVMRE